MKQCLSEEDEQKALVQYLELKGIKFTAIPNSTWTSSWTQKNKNKAMGVRPGLPDLLLIIKNNLVFIEMKRTKNSRLSKVQKEWIAELNNCHGVNAHVCKGFDQAKEVIEEYLEEGRPSLLYSK